MVLQLPANRVDYTPVKKRTEERPKQYPRGIYNFISLEKMRFLNRIYLLDLAAPLPPIFTFCACVFSVSSLSSSSEYS